MKVSLAGPSYTSRSVVAAAQQTMNLYPEMIEAPNEPARIVLYGRAGIKHFVTLTPALIRCLWAGGGRLFAINGNVYTEVKENGTIIASANTVGLGTAPDPAQIFSNGHQLMIIADKNVFIDNGAGPVQAQFAMSGTGSAPGTNTVITSLTGDAFTSAMVGKPIEFDGSSYQIVGVITSGPTSVTVDRTVPAASEGTWWSPAGANVTGVTGGFLDGYFIVNGVPNPSGGTANDPGRQFFISGLNEGTQWMPLDFAVKEGHSDYINSILCDHEELWLFGTETIEVWANVGDPNFPFQRIPGAYIHDGSVATYAPCTVGEYTCWLAGGPYGETVAMRARAFQPERISTHAQEIMWNAPGFKVSDAVSYALLDGGHLFWVINFYQQQVTLVYDMAEGLWHERARYDTTVGRFYPYQAWYHAFLPEWNNGLGRHIVGDPHTGILYEMSMNFYDDDGAAIQYLRAFPHLVNEDHYNFHHRFELYMETGTGSPSPLTVALDWSDDRGHTFASPSFYVQGVQNSGTTTAKRIVWRRLGRARDRVYRIGVQGQGKVALVDAYLEVTPGDA
jgi:hypothetical protein